MKRVRSIGLKIRRDKKALVGKTRKKKDAKIKSRGIGEKHSIIYLHHVYNVGMTGCYCSEFMDAESELAKVNCAFVLLDNG